ncbi:amidohydrolase [Chthoniobacter flavus Ellin428]|uniref:Amidohydrolase n=1 Tax=Chthoniobacter flavus Ellin428 TaxID=497964 RepID=B4D7V9_9BACT|nr:guanine deaminase [Chthoniobacter flavus]EDY17482.1 amidohydrolase [Chthoniobacter flavus Ellin428]TCO92278.1 guanine deaminase [Chthoniobacter flavus]
MRGFLIDAPEYGRLRSWSDGALIIDDGQIAEIGDYETLSRKPRTQPVRWLQSKRVAVFPGLIDLHTHLPQYPAVARGTSELLPWLRTQIFPLEREFTGPKGRREAGAFFPELARHGTTTAMIYTAIFEDSTDAAFHAAVKSGMRIIMGKMMMDVGSYGSLQPTKIVSISLHESERLCKTWHGASEGLVEYAFSPRFAVACSEKLMRGAAELATQYGAYLQTHLAENREEIEKVRNQFSWAKDYTEVYEKYGLLGPRTVLGHCLHLCDRERAALAAAGASVAHCPTANLFLRSGILPLEKVRAAGLRVGLGSDVAAGPELNLWQVMRSAIESQKARSFYEPETPIPSPASALHLATQGAAEALGKGGTIGSFEIGKDADLTLMDFGALLPYRQNAKNAADLTAEDIVSLCIYRGGPPAVLETFVRGRSIYRAPEPELF